MIDSKIKVHCTDNGKDLDGYILGYKPQGFLDVAIQTLKIRLTYRPQTKVFVGSLACKEFVVREDALPQESRKEYQR